MFARLFGNSKPRSSTRARFGSGFERLEDRSVPAIISYTVNTGADSAFDHFNAFTGAPPTRTTTPPFGQSSNT